MGPPSPILPASQLAETNRGAVGEHTHTHTDIEGWRREKERQKRGVAGGNGGWQWLVAMA